MIATVLLATCALSMRGVPSTSYDLMWRPRLNDELSYKLQLDVPGALETFTFSMNIKNRVVKIRSNGDYDVETILKDGRVKHGEHDDALPDDQKPVTDTYNRRGAKIATTELPDPSDNGDSALNAIDSITEGLTPATPVHVGDKWTVLIKPNPKFKREAGKVVYTLVGAQDQGPYHALKVSFSYRETAKDPPITSEGYILVNQPDNSMVRFNAIVKGAHLSDDPANPTGDATVSVIRN